MAKSSKTSQQSKYAKYITPIISFVVAIALFVIPKLITKKPIDIVNALDVLSLLIAFSSILGFFFVQFVNQNKNEHRSIEKKIQVLSGDFTPQDYSPAGNEPNASFNAVIKQEICKSRCHHFYFSNRSFYHTWRLHNYPIDRRTSEFKIALPHIKEDKIFSAIADNRIELEKPTGSIQEIKAQYIKDARVDSFLSFFFAKRLIEEGLNISILVHTEIPFIRFELTDNILAMSFLPMTSGGKYPPSIIYGNGSLNWDAFNAYSRQITEGAQEYLRDAKDIERYLQSNFDPIKLGLSVQTYKEYLPVMDSKFQSVISANNI